MRQKIIFSILALVLAGALILWTNYKFKSEGQIVSGTVQSGEIYFGSREGGRISSVHVREGALLEIGMPILDLAKPELSEESSIIRGQIALEKAKLSELENGSRIEDIAAAEASMNSLKAEYQDAVDDIERKKKLYQASIISKDEWDQVRSNTESLKQKYNQSAQLFQKTKQGPRRETILAQRELVDSYYARLEQVQARLQELKITSPCKCQLSEFELKAGNLVQPGEILGLLLDLDDVWIEAYLPIEYHHRLQVNDDVEIFTLDGHSDYKGEVSFIGLKAEYTPRNIQTVEGRREQVFKVKVRPDKNAKLRPGMELNMKFNWRD